MTIQTISTENLPVIAHNQIPVVTTELLAKLYGTESVRIRQNFDRNTERFIEGKHFFKVTGEELKNFASSLKILTNPPIEVSSKTRSLILWTERGAARHAKMLDTDQAWEVFEKLEDCYFGKQPEPIKNPRLQLRNIIHAIAKGDRQTYSNLYNRLYRKFQVTSYKDLSVLSNIIYQYQPYSHVKPVFNIITAAESMLARLWSIIDESSIRVEILKAVAKTGKPLTEANQDTIAHLQAMMSSKVMVVQLP